MPVHLQLYRRKIAGWGVDRKLVWTTWRGKFIFSYLTEYANEEKALYNLFSAYADSSSSVVEAVNSITATFSDFPTTDDALEILDSIFEAIFPLIVTPVLSELFSVVKSGLFDAETVVTELVGIGNEYAKSFQAVYSGEVEDTILGQNVAGMMTSAFNSLTTIVCGPRAEILVL
jgi:hypothetical protein